MAMSNQKRAEMVALVVEINRATGNPDGIFNADMSSPIKYNIGTYDCTMTNAGYELVRITTQSGGERTIFFAKTSRELYALARAFLEGIELAKASNGHGLPG